MGMGAAKTTENKKGKGMKIENRQQGIELTLPLKMEFLSVAVGSVEAAAQALGLGEHEARSLALVTEEMMAYLVSRSQDTWLQLTCTGWRYYAELRLRVPEGTAPLAAFNLTAGVSAEDEASWDNLPFIMAARMTDEMWIEPREEGYCSLVFRKEKRYPRLEAEQVQPAKKKVIWQPPFTLLAADGALLQEWCQEVGEREEIAPVFLRYPGKVADMLLSGTYEGLIAVDKAGQVAGGFLWKRWRQMVEGFGPFAWAEGAKEMLLDEALSRLGRSGAVFLCLRQGAEPPDGYFEELGNEEIKSLSGEKCVAKVWLRQLGEDNGIVVRVAQELTAYLETEYDRLALARDVRAVVQLGETLPQEAAFSVRFRADESTAVLRPLSAGHNAVQLLQEQVQVLQARGFDTVVAVLDLGDSKLVSLGSALLAAGFKPRYLLPLGGQGDLISFLYRSAGEDDL